MNAKRNLKDNPRNYYLSLGSNINPQENLPRAVELLREHGAIKAVSSVWKSIAVGSDGPDFLNAAIFMISPLSPHDLKYQVLRPIEATLGRVRKADKNADRTIDIDILIYEDEEIDSDLWSSAHLAAPLADIYPEYRQPDTGKTLQIIARKLVEKSEILRSDTSLY